MNFSENPQEATNLEQKEDACMSSQKESQGMHSISKPTLDTYIRQSQLLREKIIPFSAATLWRRVQDGSFPAPVKISQRVTAWRLQDIHKWQCAQNSMKNK